MNSRLAVRDLRRSLWVRFQPNPIIHGIAETLLAAHHQMIRSSNTHVIGVNSKSTSTTALASRAFLRICGLQTSTFLQTLQTPGLRCDTKTRVLPG